MSNSAGALANTYTFDSYGKLTASTGTITNPFQYTAREFDAETGTYEYRARYYDPSTGRFLSEDPLKFGSGVNFYAYVGNSPINLLDPSGLQAGWWNGVVNWLFPPDPPPPAPHWPAPPAPTLPFRCSFAGECDFAPDMSGALDCFRRCLGRQPAITCGRGRHPATDPHTRGLAVDIGTVANPWLTTDEARRCFGSCFSGSSYAQQVNWRPFDLQRHRDAPLFKEREEFLLHMLKRGSTRTFVQSSAGYLLRAIDALDLKKLRKLGMKEIDDATRKIWGQRVTRFSRFPGSGAAYAFRNCVKMFLLFHGKLKTRKPPRQPFVDELNSFSEYNRCRNLVPGSVESHRNKVRSFLNWYSLRKGGLSKLSIHHIDKYIAQKQRDGWSSATQSSSMQALRIFVRYAHTQGWCPDFSDCIKAPYHSRLGTPSQGRAWDEVVQLLEATNGKNHPSVRARAALMLISTYALRSSEASRLLLSDFDWKKQTVTMRRSKRGRKQRLPLRAEVTRAVLNYIRIRPRCPVRNLFVTLRPPFRSIGKGSFYCLTSRRLKKLGIASGRIGPHALRHARAMQLLRGGMTIREIGDFLGQRHPESPLFYAKFDVEMLREVADFSLEGLI